MKGPTKTAEQRKAAALKRAGIRLAANRSLAAAARKAIAEYNVAARKLAEAGYTVRPQGVAFECPTTQAKMVSFQSVIISRVEKPTTKHPNYTVFEL